MANDPGVGGPVTPPTKTTTPPAPAPVASTPPPAAYTPPAAKKTTSPAKKTAPVKLTLPPISKSIPPPAKKATPPPVKAVPAPLAGPGAYEALVTMLTNYGLQSLAPKVLEFLQDGYTQEQVGVLIQDTTEYKTRFAGNELRKAKHLAVLSPAEYLSVEAAYKQILSSNGMPVGFYDQTSDFNEWIGNDVSPAEINQRVGLAVDAADHLDPGTLKAFRDWYGVGRNDLAAFFLDRDRAMPLIQKIAKGVQIGGAYSRDGLTTTRSRAEYLAGFVGNRDVDDLAARVAEVTGRGNELSDIYGGGDYRQGSAEAEVFLNDEKARKRRLALSSYEEGAFGGSTGVGRSSLGKDASY